MVVKDILICGTHKAGQGTLIKQLTPQLSDVRLLRINNILHESHLLAESFHKILIVVEYTTAQTTNTVEIVASVLARTTCPVILIINKIDQVLAHCFGKSGSGSGFKKQLLKDDILTTEQQVAQQEEQFKCVQNPLKALQGFLEYEKKCLLPAVESFMKRLPQVNNDSLSRLQIHTACFSLYDSQLIVNCAKSLSEEERLVFWDLIWCVEDVEHELRGIEQCAELDT